MEFLVFRLPQENIFRWIKNEEAVTSTASFFPFEEGETVHLFSDKISEIDEGALIDFLAKVDFPAQNSFISTPKKEEYLEKVTQAMAVIEEHHLPKMVISRPKLFSFDKVDLAKTFFNLCQKYPQAFCYVGKLGGQLWLGASPELLGKYDTPTELFETMSLAGTLPIDEEWTEKEIEEQEAVTHYLSDVLRQFSEKIEISPIQNLSLGKIKHLKNEIKAVVSHKDLDSLVQKLHPTPAVCGIPKDFCQRKISEIERYHRGFYSGYIRIATPEKIYFFVNIRCVQFFENEAIIYAGGGITAKSNPEQEWNETELKSQSILEHIVGERLRLNF